MERSIISDSTSVYKSLKRKFIRQQGAVLSYLNLPVTPSCDALTALRIFEAFFFLIYLINHPDAKSAILVMILYR